MLTFNILESNSTCSQMNMKELAEKAALWDTFCVLNQPEFQWFLPFCWNNQIHEVTELFKALAKRVEHCGLKELERSLTSSCWKNISNLTRKYVESGGHPLTEKMLYALLCLLNNGSYEGVLERIREMEISSAREDYGSYYSSEKRKAVERAKRRVKRAERLLNQIEVPVRRLTFSEKNFIKLLKKAESKKNELDLHRS